MPYSYYFTFSVKLSQTTGKLLEPNELPFKAHNHQVPEHLRKYLSGTGDFFVFYFLRFPDSNAVNVDLFCENFPTWETVRQHLYANTEWTEQDHQGFKLLVEWFVDHSQNSVIWIQ